MKFNWILPREVPLAGPTLPFVSLKTGSVPVFFLRTLCNANGNDYLRSLLLLFSLFFSSSSAVFWPVEKMM